MYQKLKQELNQLEQERAFYQRKLDVVASWGFLENVSKYKRLTRELEQTEDLITQTRQGLKKLFYEEIKNKYRNKNIFMTRPHFECFCKDGVCKEMIVYGVVEIE